MHADRSRRLGGLTRLGWRVLLGLGYADPDGDEPDENGRYILRLIL
jgi:hypothetical protein